MTTRQTTATRRGRPPRSQKQAQDSRKAIIDAARSLFADEGYQGVSMRKIAALAECSPASLYKLFPSKRQLLLHIWQEVFDDLIQALNACYQNPPGSGQLEAMCLTFIDFWLSRPEDYRAIYLVEDQPQGEGDSYFADSASVMEALKVFRQAIVDAQARGDIGGGDPEEIQSVLLCGMQGVAMNLITIPEFKWGEPEVIKRATVRALIAGLAD